MKRALAYAGLAGRILAAGLVAATLLVISVQYGRIVARNVSLASELQNVQHDIVALRQKRADQERTIARLSDPLGAIPEIHDRLGLVAPNETIVYLKKGRPPEP